MSQTTDNGAKPTFGLDQTPLSDFSEMEFVVGKRAAPSPRAFPDDKRSASAIANSHEFLAFFARYRSVGIVALRGNVILNQAIAKHFAGRLENDGAFALGANQHDLPAFASLPWEAGRIERSDRGNDLLEFVTRKLDEYDSRILLRMPIGVAFVDRMAQECVDTGRELPAVLRVRGIKAKPGTIVTLIGRPAVEIPLRLDGFGSFTPQVGDEEFDTEAEEPKMAPLFGASVSKISPMPTGVDLEKAFRACNGLVDALSPAPGSMRGPSLIEDIKEVKMDSKLVHNPNFQPSPLPMRR